MSPWNIWSIEKDDSNVGRYIGDLYASFRWSLEDYLHLVEFIYNNSYQVSIKLAFFEALYEKKYRSPAYCNNIKEMKLLRLEIIIQMVDKVSLMR